MLLLAAHSIGWIGLDELKCSAAAFFLTCNVNRSVSTVENGTRRMDKKLGRKEKL